MSTKKNVVCHICGKKFFNQKTFKTHLKYIHGNPTLLPCHSCSYKTPYKSALKRHLEKHKKTTEESDIPSNSTTSNEPPRKKQKRSLKLVSNTHGLPEVEPPSPQFNIQTLLDEGYSTEAAECLVDNLEFVRTKYTTGTVKSQYNIRFRSEEVDIALLKDLLTKIHNLQSHAYKINIGFGVLLQHKVTEEWRYFYPINPSRRFWPKPITIQSLEDLLEAVEYIDAQDIEDHLSIQRDDTRYILRRLVCFNVVVFSLPEYPVIGDGGGLPNHIVTHRFIKTLRANKNGILYKDKLCLFRCISYHLTGGDKKLQTHAKELDKQFRKRIGISNRTAVKMDHLYSIEKYFGLKISVYTLEADETCGTFQARLIRRSPRTLSEAKNGELFLDHTSGHMSVITSIENYAQSFVCNQCKKLFKDRYKCKLHQNKCYKMKNRAVYVGGAYKNVEDVFHGLSNLGYHINPEDRFCQYFTVFDFETTSEPLNETENLEEEKKLRFIRLLEPLSCSINSSVPGFQQPHFIRRYTTCNEFMDRVVQYLCDISETAGELREKQFAYVFEQIQTGTKEIEDKIRINRDDEDVRSFRETKLDHVKQLEKELKKKLQKHVIYAFNGSRFDLKVVRKYLIKQLFNRGIPITNVIKRQGAYSLLQTPTLVFKDMACLLGPGTSLQKFFQTFNLPVSKWSFPYSHVTSLKILDETCFPPYEAFWNSLKDKYLVSEEEYKEIAEWYSKNASCLWDYLKEYNNRDVISMIPGLEKLREFWKDYGICMISEGISLSSLSSRLMFKSIPENCPFVWLPHKNSSFVYDLASDSVVGGPALVWKRKAVRNETLIREGPNQCQSILGLDAAALYLSCLEKDMPTSYPISWKQNPSTEMFERKILIPKWTSMEEIEYCFWIQHSRNDPALCHVYNYKQRMFGKKKYRPDAYSARDNKVSFFNGCWWHFCKNCDVGKQRAIKEPEKAIEIRNENAKMLEYFEKLGFSCEVMTGCQWSSLKRSNSAVTKFLDAKLGRSLKYQSVMTEKQLLEHIRNGKLFGLARVSLHVPKSHYEKFKEFCPIFKKRLITREDLSPYALKVAEENDLLKHGRNTLVSVMKAKNIVLITPLIQWYMQHGLVIDEISEVVQFKPAKLYNKFVDNVTMHRKMSDIDASKKILGEMHKLTGNAGYGKTLEKKSEFVNVRFKNESQASECINKEEFLDVEEISDNLYEVTMVKQRYRETVPRLIGAFVLGYAKLRLLEMYHDFVDVYWDRSHWELICADTDNMSINAESLESFEKMVREDMRTEYNSVRNRFLSTDKATERQPGLFKVEFQGTGIVSLCPKMYYAWNDNDATKDKKSCKGINQRDLLMRDKYLQVLESEVDIEFENKGLRYYKGQMYEYRQRKRGLINFYIKRRLNEDGITTDPIIE